MKTVIVYESVYGNTRLVAEEIATGVRQSDPEGTLTVTRCDAARADMVADADLLIAGGRWRRPRRTRVRRATSNPARKDPGSANGSLLCREQRGPRQRCSIPG